MSKNKISASLKIKNKNVGPIVGTLVVIIVLIVGALYAFASHINKQVKSNLNANTSVNGTQKGADDIKTLKNDLNNAIK